jgi:ornithine cyclodeaminase/alanine dehydrogenase-like protein (mu-crystallin family)
VQSVAWSEEGRVEKVLIANQREVTQLLPMAECIDVMTETLEALAEGKALLPLRTMMLLPDGESLMGVMPSYLGNIQSMGVKVISAFPINIGSEYDTHQGVVILFDAKYGVLRAIVDGTSITAIRTAAVSGVATRLLAREQAGDLALIGAGTQARTHLEAMKCVRQIRRVRVHSLPLDGAYAFAERESMRHGIPVEVKETAREAVEGADIICTLTTAREPVLKGEWVTAGAHINAVGAYTPTTRELDSQAVAQARLFVDRKEATLHEAGEFLIPKSEGRFGDEHILAELGELLTGKATGRRSPGEITLFKSLGIAIEDLAAANHVLQKARQTNLGLWAEIGGQHFVNV